MKKEIFMIARQSGMIFCAKLMKDGKSESVIVLDENASKPTPFCAQALQYDIQKMTGMSLAIITKVLADIKTKIYVGESETSRKAGIGDFKFQEYQGRSKGNDIFLLGCDGLDKEKVDYQNALAFPNFWKRLPLRIPSTISWNCWASASDGTRNSL